MTRRRLNMMDQGGGGPYPGKFVYDEFTDVDTTALAAHVPNKMPVGAVWTALAGTYVITSNKAAWATNGGGGYSNSVIESSKANCVVSAICNTVGDTNWGVAVRVVDINNWFAGVASPTGNQLLIFRYIAGAGVVVAFGLGGSVVIDPGTDYLMTVTCAGDDITVEVNGVSLTWNDAQLNTATKHGLYGEGAMTFDDFTVA